MPYAIPFLILALSIFLSACSVNPVTGEKQIIFASLSEEVKIGKEQYKPSQQSQGGQYLLDPKLSAYINKVGQTLAAVSDQPGLPYEFVVLNNSVPNAWALPSGKIAINRGLLTKLTNEAQLAAVLSHEIVHAAARHGAQRMRDNMLTQVGVQGLGLALGNNDYRDLIIGGASLGAQLTTSKYGRDHELESDQYGMKYMAKTGYNLQGAVELQELFLSFSKGKESSWFEGLLASHPPSQERVSENKKHQQQYPSAGNFTGKREYREALSYLMSKLEAYEFADKANVAHAKKDDKKALWLINKAIEIEPNEALFRSILGGIYDKQGEPTLALIAHNKATELNPEQFSYYLKRANSFLALNQTENAQADLMHSMALLPSSSAALQLGNLFQQNGHEDQAIDYFTQAATSHSKTGSEARKQLARLDINDNPNKYLKVTHIQDPKGPLLVSIENRSPLTITKITFKSQLFNEDDTLIKEESWNTTEAIASGKRSRYYPIPVSYHLPPDQKVKTIIKMLETK